MNFGLQERILALVILGGVAVFGLSSAQTLLAMSWGQTDTLYELIYRVLLLVIAIELVRTLVTHDLRAILELLAFVVARKMLKPDLNVIDIVLSVLAFVALLAAIIGGSPLPRLKCATRPMLRRELGALLEVEGAYSGDQERGRANGRLACTLAPLCPCPGSLKTS